MAGGTGGHVYPALAVAEYLRGKGVPVLWLGTATGLEARVAPEKGYGLFTIRISGLRGKGILRWLSAPFMLLMAIIQATHILLRTRPGIVLGMGGFVSGPGGVAAWILRIPLYIHEQNSIAGLTNRLLAPMAKIVMQGFPGTFKTGARIRTTGNPVRSELNLLPGPEQRLSGRKHDSMRLLVLGGSQGARILNEKVPAAFSYLQEDMNIQVWHQTGSRHFIKTKASYDPLLQGHQIRIDPYIDDMGEAYGWADLVLCRAGALTIAELCVVGVASILIPYSYAADDHQTANARRLSDKGCAVLIPEPELEEKRLALLLCEFSRARKRLLEMAQRARKVALPHATREVGNLCMEAINV